MTKKKFNILHWENFVIVAWVFSIVSLVYEIKANNLIQLDMLFVMFFLSIGVIKGIYNKS